MNDINTILEESGLTKGYIARMLGISRTALNYKMRGLAEFKPSEIKCLRELLKLSDAEICEIFLS